MERLKNIEFVRQHDGRILEFMRYCMVGTIAAGIHYGIYFILQRNMNVNVAYTIGYATSFICNFFMTSFFTFRRSPSMKKAVGFGAGHLINYTLHMILFNLFLLLGISRLLAPVFVLLVVVPTNFFILRFVFHKR